MKRLVFGVTVLLLFGLGGILAPILSPYPPGSMDITQRLLAPSLIHWLGTDLRGIDVFTSLLYGARVSLGVSFITVFISTLIGVPLGLMAGYCGGWIDQILMRMIDVWMAFPGILMALAISALLPPTYGSLILAISVSGWIGPARLVRGEVLSLREREFIVAAQALGAGSYSIVFKHILPQILPFILTHMTLSISYVIVVESSLSFLGLGPREAAPSWGQLLSEGRTVMLNSPWLAMAPGVAIFMVVLAINLMGDQMRDWFDPTKRAQLG